MFSFAKGFETRKLCDSARLQPNVRVRDSTGRYHRMGTKHEAILGMREQVLDRRSVAEFRYR